MSRGDVAKFDETAIRSLYGGAGGIVTYNATTQLYSRCLWDMKNVQC